MGLKAALSKVFAAWVNKDLDNIRKNSVALQQKTFQYLISSAKNTAFGKDHHFETISSYEDFKRQVAIRDYEDLRPYIDRVTHGDPDILWSGKSEYLYYTWVTTCGIIFFAISNECFAYVF